MVKKILVGSCIVLSCAACTSEITRLKETEYLRTNPARAVVYPEGVDQPAQEKSYVIPELPRSARPAAESEAPELLALPPRLVGVDTSEDEEDEDEENKESEDQVGETPEPVDEDLLPDEEAE